MWDKIWSYKHLFEDIRFSQLQKEQLWKNLESFARDYDYWKPVLNSKKLDKYRKKYNKRTVMTCPTCECIGANYSYVYLKCSGCGSLF